jgi:cell division protein FtsI (penicillin-binding protein 3)
VNNFVGVFPADKPEYVIAVLFEDPVAIIEGEEKRTPGWTVVPAATEIIRRVSGSLPLDH